MTVLNGKDQSVKSRVQPSEMEHLVDTALARSKTDMLERSQVYHICRFTHLCTQPRSTVVAADMPPHLGD